MSASKGLIQRSFLLHIEHSSWDACYQLLKSQESLHCCEPHDAKDYQVPSAGFILREHRDGLGRVRGWYFAKVDLHAKLKVSPYGLDRR